MEKVTGHPLFPVTVVNLRTQKATYTNSEGFYSIEAIAGDKLAFSFIGYKTKQLQMPISIGTYVADVPMEMMSYRLQELYIMPDYTPYQLDSIERSQIYKGPMSIRRSNPLTSPLSFIAEKFSRRSKQVFKFQKNFGKWESERFIDTRYTPQLVQQLTGLQGDSIGYFMNAYPMPYDYARAATELELKMWIRFNYKNWLKMIDTTGIPKVDASLLEEDMK